MKRLAAFLLGLVIASTVLALALPRSSAAVTLTAAYSSMGVANADLDGNPATGDWSDATTTSVPLDNGQTNGYGTATLYIKHDGSRLYARVDGQIDVPWTSPTGNHFWLGFLLGPQSATGHHKAGQDDVFFGETTYGGVAYPPTAIDTNGGAKPPAKDASQDVTGTMRYSGTAAPYAFTAEWSRALNTGDANDLVLLPDGTTSYIFSITTDSNGRGSSGGSLDHSVITNDNTLRLAKPSTSDATPPSVSIDSPGNGTSVQGNVAVAVTATDNVAVDHVELYVNGTLLGTDPASPYAFTWDTSTYKNGPYRLTAKAFDTSFNNATRWIDVTLANPDTVAPVANAGPDQSVPPNVAVTLDGSGSTDNQGIVSWNWTFSDPTPKTLGGKVVTYTFANTGHFLITLTVKDGAGNAASDTAWVNVTGDTQPPVARAGADVSVLPGTSVTLDASASTDDVGIANYTWAWTEASAVVLYGQVVSRVFDVQGDFLVTLTVRDFVGNAATDTLWVNVTLPVDWATAPVVRVGTTEGKFLQDVDLQVAVAQGQIFFRANFTYAGTITDPDLVYFALEFDKSGKAFPMSAGDEMIIVSRNGPDGQPMTGYSYSVTTDQTRPVPILPSPATLVSYRVAGNDFDLVFARPLAATDPAREMDLSPDVTVKVAVAMGEWGQGASHSYSQMAWTLTVSGSGAVLAPLAGAGDPAAMYELAGLLGQIVLVATIGVVVFHALRRKVWRGQHPVELYCDTGEKVAVERHSLGVRILHWAHVGLMFGFIATGWSIFVQNPIFGASTLPVHIVFSVVILAIDYPLHFYFMWKSGEVHFLFLPWKDDLLVAVSLMKNFFYISKTYEEHATVDPETREWYKGRKYCAFQKGLLLMDLAAMFVMALSGYALYAPASFGWLYDFVRPWGGYYLIRGFHLLMFYYFVSTLIAHAYLSFIPMNWGKLRSIVFGDGKVHTHRKETPAPEPPVPVAMPEEP